MVEKESNILLRAFGNLEGTVASMATQWRQQEQAASDGRRVLYSKFEEILGRVNTLSHNIDNLQQDLTDLKRDIETKVMPSIEAYNLKQAEKRGAHGLIRLVWLGLLAAVSAASYGLHQFITWLSGKP